MKNWLGSLVACQMLDYFYFSYIVLCFWQIKFVVVVVGGGGVVQHVRSRCGVRVVEFGTKFPIARCVN